MDEGAGKLWIDRRITQSQIELFDRLSGYSHAAAVSYKGALYAYHRRDDPDRGSHFAYSLRDVIDLLAKTGWEKIKTGHVSGNDRGRTRTNPGKSKGWRWGRDTRLAGLAALFDPLTRQQYGYGTEYRVLVDKFAQLSEIGHKKLGIDTEKMDEILAQIENILHLLTRRQSEINDEIKQILQNPSAEGAKRLMAVQTNGATHIRIARSLTPDWLRHMADEGYFRDPRKGEYWIAHKYLARCAKSHPEKVAEIITSSYSTEALERDTSIYIDLIRCVPDLPPEHAAKVARHIIGNKWYERFWADEESYLGIARYMYLEGMHDVASDLLLRAFSVPAPDPSGLGLPDTEFAMTDMGNLVDGVLEKAGKIDLLPMLGTLADLLDQAIRSDSGPGDIGDAESSMSVWRPTIEDSGENWTRDLKSSFVGHVRDCLLAIGTKDRGNLKRAMDVIKRRKYLVWRRIEMFMYGSFPDRFVNEAEIYAIRYLGDADLGRANQAMLGRCFAWLPAPVKREVLARIDGGLDHEEFERISRQAGRERAEIVQDKWVLRYLETLSDNLDAKHREKYIGLVGRYGRAEDPERSSTDYEEDVPDHKPARTEFKGIDDAFGYVAGYVPDNVVPPDYTIRGFSNIVSRHPLEASRRAPKLKEAHQQVLSGFFEGLGNARRGDEGMDWEALVPLMRDVSSRVSKGEVDGDGVGRMICRMLRSEFSKDMPGIEHRAPLWEIVESLERAGREDKDYCRRDFEERGDGHTISINNLEGLSFHALVLYAIWAARKGDDTGLDPGVRKVLDGYVDDPGRHTVSRSSALGRYLPSLYGLDKEWMVLTAKRMRGSETANAFWEGYVRWNRLYADVFSDLGDLYGQFLIGERSPGIRKTEMFKSTFDHVLLTYLYGEGAGTMFEDFLRTVDEESPDELVDHCIFRVGMVIRGEHGDPDFDPGMLDPLWLHPVLLERDLTSWFVGSKMDRRASISMYSRYVHGHTGRFRLTYRLMDELASYAPEFPDEVYGCLDRLVVSAVDEFVPDTVCRVVEELEKAGKDCRMIVEKIKSRAY
ncbi:hypothetical protein IBTHAUMO2_1050016 [Nitrosopumilaceae archaeon]|nr:hypothetical protein IBTHAUMO2_1050016 [Nitrosopumilaceae archaeon]